MDYVDRFVATLTGLDAPLLRAVRPGLSPEQVVTTVRSIRPELVDAIDEAIIGWWGWQNGIDPERNAETLATDAGYVIVNAIGPDGLGLASLADLLRRGTDALWVGGVAGVGTARFLPIGSDDFGKTFGLTKGRAEPGSAAAWQVVWTTGDLDGWQPLAALAEPGPRAGEPIHSNTHSGADSNDDTDNRNEAVLFSDYLLDMVDAMEAGTMAVQPWGGVTPA